MHRQVVGLGRRQARGVGAVDQQPPDVLERDPADDVLDVDAAVAERGAFLVGLGDLGLERDDPSSPSCTSTSAPSSAMSRILPYRRDVGDASDRSDHRDALDSVAAAREEYTRGGLVEADLLPDPIAMFRRWYDEAHEAGLHEPNAMVVATVVRQTFAPSARLVLLKGVSDEGFVFYTNTGSRKGAELAGNPRCALLFPWHPLERQVRVDGTAALLPARARSTRTSRSARAAPSSAPGPRTSPRVVAGRDELDGGVRRGRARGTPAATYRRPRSGAATSSTRSRWSSGRAGPAGCTTGWSTGARADGWRTERLAP